MRSHTLTTTVLLAVLLSGCGDGADRATVTDDPPEDTMASTSPSVPGADRPQARAAVADLAARLGVDADEVTVVAVEEVAWRDGSLGCAEQGRVYTQALVDGHRITLAVGEERYEYHDGGGGDPFLCESPTQ